MLAALLAPMVVLVSSARGDIRVPVRLDPQAGPVLAAPVLLGALGGHATTGDGWADVIVGSRTFHFILGAPLYRLDGKLQLLVGSASVRRDTLQLPIQFVSEVLPRTLAGRFRYDARQARLVDAAPVVLAAKDTPRDPNRLANGLRRGHVVTIDAGHGGVDPGNPGLFFPGGLKEKDVTLQLSLMVREELLQRGVGVILTRRTDTLIDLRSRGGYCRDDCDLFVSLHVNSLPRRPGYQRVRGFETYFLAEAKTEDAARVARMENEAIRFEGSGESGEQAGGLDFILKDLQLNEHLRESARAAELVQSYLQETHTGPDLGVKQAGFMVLTTARRPAILIETGYSTNPEDARLLTSRASQRNLAASIADAVVAYLLEYERKIGLAPPQAVSNGRAGR
jgi:N-acetylmuramoyl-L-alanine amidase